MLEPRTPGDVIACEMRLSALVLLARALYGTQGPTEVEDRCCGDLVKACSTRYESRILPRNGYRRCSKNVAELYSQSSMHSSRHRQWASFIIKGSKVQDTMGHLIVGRTGFLNTEPALQQLLAGGARPTHRFLLETTESSRDIIPLSAYCIRRSSRRPLEPTKGRRSSCWPCWTRIDPGM